MIKVNGKLVKTFMFSGGELSVALPMKERYSFIAVEAMLRSSDDIMKLVMITSALREQYCGGEFFSLKLPYFPYARQDRVCVPGQAHGVKAMAAVINLLGYNQVTVLDPHSDAVGAALNNCTILSQAQLAKPVVEYLLLKQKYELVAPDAGAEKKVNELAKLCGSWGLTPPVHYARKIRNLANGEITGVACESDVKGKKLLIVDDICDGGRTFVELAALLLGKGAECVELYVTHGIFSKGLSPLEKSLKHVYAHHSFDLTSNEFLTVASEV